MYLSELCRKRSGAMAFNVLALPMLHARRDQWAENAEAGGLVADGPRTHQL